MWLKASPEAHDIAGVSGYFETTHGYYYSLWRTEIRKNLEKIVEHY